jgi:Peptidase family M23
MFESPRLNDQDLLAAKNPLTEAITYSGKNFDDLLKIKTNPGFGKVLDISEIDKSDSDGINELLSAKNDSASSNQTANESVIASYDISNAFDILTGEVIQELTADLEFKKQMNLAFGDTWDQAKFQELVQKVVGGDYSELPDVQVMPAVMADSANAAFDKLNNTIYVSSKFLAENSENQDKIAAVLVEELGHFIDSKINKSDAAGDEGAIFSALIQGEKLALSDIADLKAEDDTKVFSLGGQDVLVEMAFRGTVDSPVNIRRGPGTTFSINGGLNSGSRTFDLVSSGTTHWDAKENRNDNRWFRILGTTDQWVSAAFITGNPAFSGGVDQTVNVRSGPGTNFSVVGSLNGGARQNFDGVNVGTTHWDSREGKNENRWFRVEGSDRWVSAAFITGEPNYSATTTPTPQPPSSNSSYTYNDTDYLNTLYRDKTNNQITRKIHDGTSAFDSDGDSTVGNIAGANNRVHALVGGVVVEAKNGIERSSNKNWRENGTVAIYNAQLDKTFIYWHLAQGSINQSLEGKTISAGSQIGVEGNTGLSYGAHTHVEVHQGRLNIDMSRTNTGIPANSSRLNVATVFQDAVRRGLVSLYR